MTAPQRPEPFLDPDPKYVEQPDSIRAMRDRETQDEWANGRRVGVVLAFAWTLAFIAIVAVAMLVGSSIRQTPRSAPDPTTGSIDDRPTGGASDPTSQWRGTSGPGLIGAPDERLDTAASGPVDRHDAGAPLPDTATVVIRGTATWMCDPPRWRRCTRGYPESSYVAARGSEIPASWRGKLVRVWHRGRHVDVRIVDACLCKGERVIDLYAVAFRRLAPQGTGEISVRVELLGSGALPPTGTGS